MKKEKVTLARIYSEDGRIGIELTPDAVPEEVKYFLESYVKVEREAYEDQFTEKEGNYNGIE